MANEKEYHEYLEDIVEEQRDEWIHPAIAAHLGQKFPEIKGEKALKIVKEWIKENPN